MLILLTTLAVESKNYANKSHFIELSCSVVQIDLIHVHIGKFIAIIY